MSSVEGTDVGFGKAIARGVIAGWIVFPFIVLFIASIGAPESSWSLRIGASAVVGFWVGLFFGGVVSVAAYMLKAEKDADEGHSSPADVDKPSVSV